MALLHYLWSRTAASNATADSAVNWAEGQSPSSVNDSARAMMASAAGFRDDISGATVTGGTSTAYTLSTYQVFDTLAHMSGQMVAFTPHATNGATVTLNVDSLGAKPLRSSPNVELLAGMLVLGTPYVAVYNNSDAAWYLQGFYGNPYNVPLCSGMDYWGTTAPNSSFIFPLGQAISRTTYASAFAIMGTTYGSGDGSTTFNVPDKGERVSVMKVATGTRLTTAGSGVDGGAMGSAGGGQTGTVAQANLPNLTLNLASQPIVTIAVGSANGNFSAGATKYYNGLFPTGGGGIDTQTYTSSGGTVSLGGSGTAMNNVQPTIVCNYIIRII